MTVATTRERTGIFIEVNDERQYQINKHGVEFDDHNFANDWLAYIMQHAGRGYATDRAKYPTDFREAMVKTAALAVAAIEAYDRNNV